MAPDYSMGRSKEDGGGVAGEGRRGLGVGGVRRGGREFRSSHVDDPDSRWVAKTMRHAASPAAALALTTSNWRSHSGVLSTVQAPTLVLSRSRGRTREEPASLSASRRALCAAAR